MASDRPRVLVAGAGAIGQWLGARLAAAGQDVTLLLRERFARAIAQDGLRVTGHSEFQGPVACITEPGGGPFDVIILTCKAYATASLAGQVAPLLAADGVLASMQNGLGNGEKLERAAPGRCALALTSNGAMIEGPGRVRHAGLGATTVGALPRGREGPARRLQEILAGAGLDPAWSDDMRAATWTKAIVNAAINPIGALYGVVNGDVLDRGELSRLSRSLAEEATALAKEAGVDVADDPWPAVATVLRATASNKCSMLQDVEAERPTEIEQITGRMVRLGEELRVPMPHSGSMYDRIKDVERGYLGAAASKRLAVEELQHLHDAS